MHLKIGERYLYSTQTKQYIVRYTGNITVDRPVRMTHAHGHFSTLQKTRVKDFIVVKSLFSDYEFNPVSIQLDDIEVKNYIFPVDEIINSF